MTDGYARLTLAAVGKELGCSAPALSKRFGSKRGLIEAYLEWSEETIRERFALVRGRFASPLEALLNRYLLPGDRPEEFGPFRTWTEAWSDTSLAEATYQLRRVWEAEAEISLRDARMAGELIECDLHRLSIFLVAALSGVTILHAPGRESLPERLIETFELVIGPYRARGEAAVR